MLNLVKVNNLGRIGFNFKDQEKPMSLVSSVASDMHSAVPMERILSSSYFLTRFEPSLVEELCALLTPQKMRVTVLSRKYKGATDRVEKWYGTEYAVEKISEQFVAKLDKGQTQDVFALPRYLFVC